MGILQSKGNDRVPYVIANSNRRMGETRSIEQDVLRKRKLRHQQFDKSPKRLDG